MLRWSNRKEVIISMCAMWQLRSGLLFVMIMTMVTVNNEMRESSSVIMTTTYKSLVPHHLMCAREHIVVIHFFVI